jgi:hypothetical protein
MIWCQCRIYTCIHKILGSHGSELTLMMVEISETLVFNSTLTWPIVQEDFSTFICCESFESYTVNEYYNYIPLGCDVMYQHFRRNILPSCSSKTLITTYETIQCHNAAYHNHNHHSSCSDMTNLYRNRKVNYEQCGLVGLTACSSKGAWHGRNVSPPSSGQRAQLTALFLLGIFFNPKNGDNVPLKLRAVSKLHDITSQNTILHSHHKSSRF